MSNWLNIITIIITTITIITTAIIADTITDMGPASSSCPATATITIITTTIGTDQAKGRPFWLPFQK
jgi:hypothetical protein